MCQAFCNNLLYTFFMSVFSERLKNERISKGYTQKRVAEVLGVTYNAISQYENGVREPNIDFLIKICDFFDVSSDYLLGRTDY